MKMRHKYTADPKCCAHTAMKWLCAINVGTTVVSHTQSHFKMRYMLCWFIIASPNAYNDQRIANQARLYEVRGECGWQSFVLNEKKIKQKKTNEKCSWFLSHTHTQSHEIELMSVHRWRSPWMTNGNTNSANRKHTGAHTIENAWR